MRAEAQERTTSLKDIAEVTPTLEKIQLLRSGFTKLIDGRGEDRKGKWWLLEVEKRVYSGNIEIEGKNVAVRASRAKGKHPDNYKIVVNIGMRLDNGERVSLVLDPTNGVEWLSLDRGYFGGSSGLTPTENDLGLFAEVLEHLDKNTPDTN